jgi:hypothetical protein
MPVCFLVGAERSGTTMLRLMLDHHPQIAWCNEFEYAVDRVTDEGRPPDVAEYVDWLSTHRVFQNTGFQADPRLAYQAVIAGFLEQRRSRTGKPLVGATVHRHFDRLLPLFPDARFIHLVRDGRDVAKSCVGMGWNGNVWTAVHRWIDAEKLWSQLCGRLEPRRRHEVKYETLVSSPEATLAETCDFLGVEYDSAMLDYADNSTYERPDARLAQQWRTKFSEKEIRLVESRIGPLLAERGYEPSGLPPLQPSLLTRLGLVLSDRWFRARFRLRRYGLRLTFADFLARRSGVRRWRHAVRRRINAIENAHLR